jgi:hypothetical protein
MGLFWPSFLPPDAAGGLVRSVTAWLAFLSVDVAAGSSGSGMIGRIGTTPIFVTPYRSYSTGTDGASDTTHTAGS